MITQNSLKIEVAKRKQEFLIALHAALDRATPRLFEKAVILLSEFLDNKWITESETLALHAEIKAVRCLAPKRPTEESNYAVTRQLCGINVICLLDKWNVEWNEAMSEELARVNGVDTVTLYLEQNQHDTYKSQAAEIVGMISDQGTINHLLREQDTLSILVESLRHKSLIVKQNVAEALGVFLKDPEVHESLDNDRILQVLMSEYHRTNDQNFLESLLLCLMNLSNIGSFKVRQTSFEFLVCHVRGWNRGRRDLQHG